MSKWLRKMAVGFMAASTLYTCGYVGGGFFYDLARTGQYLKSNGTGNYNRDKENDPTFRKEFMAEASGLEKMLNLGSGHKAQYTIDVYVSENVKLFFDDRDDPDDNAMWTEYIKEAVESLNEYGRADIGFKLGEVIGVKGSVLTDHTLYLSAVNKGYDPDRIDLAFIPSADLRLEKGVVGWAIPDENFAVVTITNNRHRNQSLTLHEIGHLLELKHKFISDMKRMLLDPYCILYTESFMSSHLDPCSSLTLKEDEIRYLKRAHSK